MRRQTLDYGTLEYWQQEVKVYTYEKNVLLNALENALRKENNELQQQIIDDICHINSMLEWSKKNLNKQITSWGDEYAD